MNSMIMRGFQFPVFGHKYGSNFKTRSLRTSSTNCSLLPCYILKWHPNGIKSKIQLSYYKKRFLFFVCFPDMIRPLLNMQVMCVGIVVSICGSSCTIGQVLPRCMKCRRGLAMRILSVCLSVCHTCDPWQNGRKIGPDFYIIRNVI